MDSGLLGMLLQSLLALAFVLGLFALLIWGMRKLKLPVGKIATSDFRVSRRLHLDNKNSLIEITHEGRRYLLGISQNSMIQLDYNTTLPATQLSEACMETDKQHPIPETNRHEHQHV